jgi:uncharacterized membrane protein
MQKGKNIDGVLLFLCKRAIFSPARTQTSILHLIQQSKQLPTAHIPSQGIQEAGDQGGMMKKVRILMEFCCFCANVLFSHLRGHKHQSWTSYSSQNNSLPPTSLLKGYKKQATRVE